MDIYVLGVEDFSTTPDVRTLPLKYKKQRKFKKVNPGTKGSNGIGGEVHKPQQLGARPGMNLKTGPVGQVKI